VCFLCRSEALSCTGPNGDAHEWAFAQGAKELSAIGFKKPGHSLRKSSGCSGAPHPPPQGTPPPPEKCWPANGSPTTKTRPPGPGNTIRPPPTVKANVNCWREKFALTFRYVAAFETGFQSVPSPPQATSAPCGADGNGAEARQILGQWLFHWGLLSPIRYKKNKKNNKPNPVSAHIGPCFAGNISPRGQGFIYVSPGGGQQVRPCVAKIEIPSRVDGPTPKHGVHPHSGFAFINNRVFRSTKSYLELGVGSLVLHPSPSFMMKTVKNADAGARPDPWPIKSPRPSKALARARPTICRDNPRSLAEKGTSRSPVWPCRSMFEAIRH